MWHTLTELSVFVCRHALRGPYLSHCIMHSRLVCMHIRLYCHCLTSSINMCVLCKRDRVFIHSDIQYSTSLVHLNLRRTGITATDPDTAMSLKKMLKANKSLKHLDLSQNESFSLEAHCIFEGLEYNTSLVQLNLCHTGITTILIQTLLRHSLKCFK